MVATRQQKVVIGVAARREFGKVIICYVCLALRGRKVLLRRAVCLFRRRCGLDLLEFPLRVIPLDQRWPGRRLHHVR